MKQKGAKIIIDCLLEQGVDTVFGYPGANIIDVFDALYDEPNIKLCLTAHEQGATHAADGYARVTAKPAVVIATSGPGATNLVTGIATAYMDSVPLVVITGNVALNFLGRDSFQEIDIAGITMPITKHNCIVKDISELASTIREAFAIAVSSRPGPVLIDIPKNIQQELFEYEKKEIAPTKEFHSNLAQLDSAIKLIKSSKMPYIYYGGGVITSNASSELVRFAELIDAPVASSMMGLGGFPCSHPLFTGMLGMHGKAGVNRSIAECDLLIAIGARFSDRVASNRATFCSGAKIIHIDIDNAEIDKNILTDCHLIGDAKTVLTKLMENLPQLKHTSFLSKVKRNLANSVTQKSEYALDPRKIIRAVASLAPDNIIATDVGQHQMWTAQNYPFEKPRTFVTSGGLGTMGFGLGASIGACIGSGKKVTLITGDGSFHMNLNELATAVKYDLPITIILMNNNTLGMVRQWQTLFYNQRYMATTLNLKTDYVALISAFGGKGYVLDNDNDINKILPLALASSYPTLVDCRLNSGELVLPMIEPGKSISEVIEKI